MEEALKQALEELKAFSGRNHASLRSIMIVGGAMLALNGLFAFQTYMLKRRLEKTEQHLLNGLAAIDSTRQHLDAIGSNVRASLDTIQAARQQLSNIEQKVQQDDQRYQEEKRRSNDILNRLNLSLTKLNAIQDSLTGGKSGNLFNH